MSKAGRARPELQPLKLSCDNADCGQGLHCFRRSKKLARTCGHHAPGACQQCGEQLVDWERVQKRDGDDLSYTFGALKREYIRHHYWHTEIDQRARNYAIRKGLEGLPTAIEKRLRSSVGVKNSRDGRQTPWDGNIVYYAQHATACCCRRCIEYWHGIAPDAPLTEDQIEYFKQLCLRFVSERMPELKQKGQPVPGIRRTTREKS